METTGYLASCRRVKIWPSHFIANWWCGYTVCAIQWTRSLECWIFSSEDTVPGGWTMIVSKLVLIQSILAGGDVLIKKKTEDRILLIRRKCVFSAKSLLLGDTYVKHLLTLTCFDHRRRSIACHLMRLHVSEHLLSDVMQKVRHFSFRPPKTRLKRYTGHAFAADYGCQITSRLLL